ncbi:MAG: hypothetical protein GY910_02990 [bacterium]|nr:hypothetical protein [Myxococcales bacterium]MCP4903921.1 hypothetical protein [bacterium]
MIEYEMTQAEYDAARIREVTAEAVRHALAGISHMWGATEHTKQSWALALSLYQAAWQGMVLLGYRGTLEEFSQSLEQFPAEVPLELVDVAALLPKDFRTIEGQKIGDGTVAWGFPG